MTPWTVAHWAPLSTGFPRQEYQAGLPCHPPGHLPDPEIKSIFPESWQGDSLPLSGLGHTGSTKEFGKWSEPYSLLPGWMYALYQNSRRKKSSPGLLTKTLHCPSGGTVPSPHTLRPRRADRRRLPALTPLSGGGNKVSDKVGSKAIRQQSFYSISGASDLGIS